MNFDKGANAPWTFDTLATGARAIKSFTLSASSGCVENPANPITDPCE